jgi:hypothetical protein
MNKYEDALDHISFGSKWKLCIGQCLRRWGYNLRQLHMIPHPYAFYPLTPFNNGFFWSWVLRELQKTIYTHPFSFTNSTSHSHPHQLFSYILLIFEIFALPSQTSTKNGFPFTCYYKDISNSETSNIKICRSEKGLCSSVCWRETEAVYNPSVILEPTFISRLVKSSWGRVWIWSSHGWTHHSLHRRCLPTYNFLLEWTMILTL